ncbi:MAG: hypothetical protein KJO21_01665 [Verrucomicrobiae bacterium]|nr:hypothetical protein [Verrucomicrobiae bacterium]NNJ42243.1 hypothetical protein [Akkermansiaceae bacterium]
MTKTTLHRLGLLALPMLISASLNAATTTNPVGVEKVTLQPNQFNLLGVRLHGEVVLTGTFDASTGSSLTDTGASFSGLVATTEYIVELADGSNFNIVGSDASGDTITLPTVDPADEQAYKIRIANTLNSVLGNPTNLASSATGNPAGTDRVWIPNGTLFDQYYYVTLSGSEGWYKVGATSEGLKGDSVVINPGAAIYVETLGSTTGTTDIMISGTVKTVPTAYTISQEWNLLSGEYPAGQTLGNSGLSANIAGSADGNPAGADILWAPNGVLFDKYYYVTLSGSEGWYKVGATSEGLKGDTVLPSGVYLQDADASGGGVITPPTSYNNL